MKDTPSGGTVPPTHLDVYRMRGYRKHDMGMFVYLDPETIRGLSSLQEAVTLDPKMRRVAFEQFEAWPLDLEKLLPRDIPLPDKFTGAQHVSDHCDAHPPTWATPEELKAWKLRFFVPDAAVLPRRANIAYEADSPVKADLNKRLSLQVAPKFATDHDWDRWREGAIAALQKSESVLRRLKGKAGSARGISETGTKELEKKERNAAQKAGAQAPQVRTADPQVVKSIEASDVRKTATPCDEPDSLSCLLDVVTRNVRSWVKK